MAAHHEESSPEYPLRFLQLNPVLVITGLGSQNEIFQTLSLLQAASMRQPHLLTFLDASFEALRREHAAFMTEFKNSHSASEPPCLLNFIKKDAKLNLDAQGAHRVYAFALETIASLGLYIAGGSKLHDRVVAHARSMIAHTSTTPLAAAVIENSPSIAAILAAGVEAVRFAFWVGVRSEIATGQEVVLHLNLLQCSLEQAAQLAEPYNLEVSLLHVHLLNSATL